MTSNFLLLITDVKLLRAVGETYPLNTGYLSLNVLIKRWLLNIPENIMEKGEIF
jgi:hypothetical protein